MLLYPWNEEGQTVPEITQEQMDGAERALWREGVDLQHEIVNGEVWVCR